ncbi:DNA-processing protein DprA [Thalassotalea agarivorans]|uniref:DNA processing protein n=1 Tax=Thalassotalea agarivorans TaxID=349064 RepID=A0A1I0GDZ1_THASX|nr:DNA-processing protein DprA [Thalassotalea agarivorans]SET69065.1 DNA processing protein [Thalassotalea agarivorans]
MPDKSTLKWIAISRMPKLSTHINSLQKKHQFGVIANQNHQSFLARAALVQPTQTCLAQAQHIAEQCAALDIAVLTPDDAAYPPLLTTIFDPPLVLYVRGNKQLLTAPQLAIIGSRNASPFGRQFAKDIATALSMCDVTITSGLAIGIDGFAHSGSVASNQPTIAVVANGLDTVYPKRHRQLAKAILAGGGAIVSEQPPGTPALPAYFPQRNRIISGLSLGTLVVEGKIKSGSLITARLALEQSREVFAVPGSPLNPNAEGCNALIRDGAHVVQSAKDITHVLSKLAPIKAYEPAVELPLKKIEKKRRKSLSSDPLLDTVDYEVTPVDEVISRCKLPTEEILYRLTMLELRGLVATVPGGFIRVKRG